MISGTKGFHYTIMHIWRTVFVLIFLFVSTLSAELTHKEFFDRYVGRWSGTIVLTDQYGRTRHIQVMQQYWWADKETLKSASIYREKGKTTSLTSELVIRKEIDKPYPYKEVTYNSKGENNDKYKVGYIGAIDKDGNLTWTPVNVIKRQHTQTKECVKNERGRWVLRINGFQQTDKKTRVTYSSTLIRTDN